MPRLTAELVRHSGYAFNPLKERELDLRGNHIPAIENLGSTNDAFDSIDLCDNSVEALENFPPLPHLTTLLLCNNAVSRIEPGLQSKLPNLKVLSLSNNRLAALADLEPLEGWASLQHVDLTGNPVGMMPGYRQTMVRLLPNLRVLDHQRVRKKERDQQVTKLSVPPRKPAPPPPPAAAAPAPAPAAVSKGPPAAKRRREEAKEEHGREVARRAVEQTTAAMKAVADLQKQLGGVD